MSRQNSFYTMNILRPLLCALLVFVTYNMHAQKSPTDTIIDENGTKIIPEKGEYRGTMTIDGTVVRILIVDGDTIPVADLEEISLTQKQFSSRDERRRYHQWRRYALKVYPYAAEAIKIYRRVKAETSNMSRRELKRYTKNVENQLRPEYETALKKLTKSQGYILIKMVERELDTPFYKVIKDLRGNWSAFKWQSAGRWYGYNLRSGYEAEDDPLLEIILSDLNISYEY